MIFTMLRIFLVIFLVSFTALSRAEGLLKMLERPLQPPPENKEKTMSEPLVPKEKNFPEVIIKSKEATLSIPKEMEDEGTKLISEIKANIAASVKQGKIVDPTLFEETVIKPLQEFTRKNGASVTIIQKLTAEESKLIKTFLNTKKQMAAAKKEELLLAELRSKAETCPLQYRTENFPERLCLSSLPPIVEFLQDQFNLQEFSENYDRVIRGEGKTVKLVDIFYSKWTAKDNKFVKFYFSAESNVDAICRHFGFTSGYRDEFDLLQDQSFFAALKSENMRNIIIMQDNNASNNQFLFDQKNPKFFKNITCMNEALKDVRKKLREKEEEAKKAAELIIFFEKYKSLRIPRAEKVIKYGGLELFKYYLESNKFNPHEVIVDKVPNDDYKSNDPYMLYSPPLIIAIHYGRDDIVQFLLKEKNVAAGTVQSDGSAAIHFAAAYSEKMVSILLENGASVYAVDSNGNSVLHFAAYHHNLVNLQKFIPMLRQDFINKKNMGGDTPLDWTNEKKDSQYLRSRGALKSSEIRKGQTPLHIAALNGDLQLLQDLVALGFNDFNVKDLDNYTPLMVAVKNNKKEIVDYLLGGPQDRNYDLGLDTQDKEGLTALHLAASNNDAFSAQKLMAKGARSDIQFGKQKLTPLMLALLNHHMHAAAPHLIDEQSINVPSASGDTPLSLVAKTANDKMLQLLIDKGAQVNTRNKEGKTPLNMATNEQVKKILKGKESLK